MPALSPTMETGKIQKWNYKVGDEVTVGDALADIETDKSTMAYEMIDDGFVAKLLFPSGDGDVPVGHPIAIIVEEKADIEKFANFTGEAPAESTKAPEPVVEVKQAQTQEKEKAVTTPAEKEKSVTTGVTRDLEAGKQVPNVSLGEGSERMLYSPLAKRMALDNGVDLFALRGMGTGERGRILAENVEAFLASHAQTQATGNAVTAQKTNKAPVQQTVVTTSQSLSTDLFEDLPISGVRKVIATRLLESKQTIPHYYTNIDVEMDNLIAFRKKLNETSPVKLSVSDLIIKAVALACNDVPEANSHWMGSSIRQYKNVNVMFALSTDGGLITPVVNDAANLRLSQIATISKDLIERGRQNKLKPEEYSNGTITISNLGMMGVSNFSAIINPPQSCILAIGSTVPKPKPTEDGGVQWVNSMTVTTSFDHRVVDGAVGALWLGAFKRYIEHPMSMLI